MKIKIENKNELSKIILSASNTLTEYEYKIFCDDFNDKYDYSSITDMRYLFSNTDLNKNLKFIPKLNTSNVIDMYGMFDKAIAFEKRFNNGKSLPKDTNDLKQLLKENRDKMLATETLNKVSTPEQKIAIIENKISNNFI